MQLSRSNLLLLAAVSLTSCGAERPLRQIQRSTPREVCDGVDNDENGLVDDFLIDNPSPCSTVGVCRDGSIVSCDGILGWRCHYTAADYEREEISCDGLDNDCDGAIDEDGICPEVCDGVDNNGNGLVDESSTPPGNCLVAGVCGQQGATETCEGVLGWVCNYASSNYEVEEVSCDELDNDCDGDVDEGELCAQTVEICDGLDNDGNGSVDDGLTPPGSCTTRGVCGDGVVETCVGASGWSCRYTSLDYQWSELTCDSLDNDCDGQIDEGGICAPAGLVLFDGYDSTLYASEDHGVTWTELASGPWNDAVIAKIVRRTDGGYLLSNTRGQTFVTMNQGATWIALPDAPWATDAPGGGFANVIDFDVSPNGDIYAISVHSQRDGELYRSSDQGQSWTAVGTWPEQTGTDTDVVVGPGGIVYIIHNPWHGAQVYRSSDGGTTITLVGIYDLSGSGGGSVAAVDSAGTVYAVGNPESTVYASVDQGVTWQARGQWLSNRSISTITITDQDEIMLVSVKGNVHRSADNGNTLTEVGDWGTAASRDIICCSGWIDLISDPVPSL